MLQIALLLPCSAAVGWLIGAGLDKWLHQKWFGIAGIVFGGITGLVSTVQFAMATERNSRPSPDEEAPDGKAKSDSDDA